MLRRLLVGWKVSLARLAKWRRWMAAGMGQLTVRVFQTFLKKVEDFVRCSCSKDVPCSRCHPAALRCRSMAYLLLRTRSASLAKWVSCPVLMLASSCCCLIC